MKSKTGILIFILLVSGIDGSAHQINRLHQHIRDRMNERFQKPVREEFVIGVWAYSVEMLVPAKTK